MAVLPPFWIWQCHVVARRPIRHFSPVNVVLPSATWNWSVWRCGENVSIKLSFQSGLLRLANRILQIIVLKLSLFSLSHISSSISKLCYLNLHLYNVSMFHVTESRSNLIQYGKQQTVSELYMDKIVLRAKWKYPDKKYELRYFNCVFLAHFFR